MAKPSAFRALTLLCLLLFAGPAIAVEAPCVPNDTTLCIDDQPGDRRFRVTVDYQTSQGGGLSGAGHAVALSTLGVNAGGIFWFFDPKNPEMLVKVLDACSTNAKRWFFASAGTNVGVTATLTDTVTGASRIYTNPDLTQAPPVQDTEALPCSGARLEGELVTHHPVEPALTGSVAAAVAAVSPGVCLSSDTTLCIDDQPGDRRFRVTVDYQTVQSGGLSGAGHAIPLNGLGVNAGGLFWFFEPKNPEMLVKILDGCAATSHKWVFASAGTNVGLETTITDMQTGDQKTYTNPDLTPAPPIQDLVAFGCTNPCAGQQPSAVISAPPAVATGSTGNIASVPDAGTGVTYAWTIVNGTITAGATSRQVTFTAGSAPVTLGVTVIRGVCVNSSTTTVPNCVPPSAAITAPVSASPGETGLTATLPDAGAGATYLWEIQNGTITSATNLRVITFTAGTTGTSTLTGTVTNAAGCSASSTKSVPVGCSPPVVVITPAGPVFLCAGSSATLVASGATSYLWSTGATTTSIVVNTVGTYTVTGTSNGCPASESVQVIVDPLPPAPTITAGGPTTFCVGGSVTLTASAGYASYLWSNGATTQAITVSASGTFTVQGTNAGCTSTASAPTTVTVNPTPAAPTITAGGPTTFCAGGSVTLTASAGYASYLWSNGATTQAITVSASGTFTVQGTNAGCTSTASAPTTVTVNPTPSAPTITAGGPTTFCAGGSVTLTASAGFASYLWSNGATTQAITVSASGTFTVQGTNAQGCTSVASAPTTVTVNPTPSAPTITAGGPTTFCAGGSVTLTASAGFASYLWSNGATTQAITVSASGTFTVQGTNAQGCTSVASAPTTVTVNPTPSAPTITAGGPTTFCAGGSVTLTASAGFASYLWSNGATTQAITVLASGTFTVQGTNAQACTSVASAPTTVTVNPTPAAPTITPGGPTTFCEGGNVVLTASAGYASYLWSNGATTQAITVSASGTFTVQGTNAQGCTSVASAPTTVTVNPTPSAPTITAGGPTTFCAGGSVTLTASAGFASYLWSNGATTQAITVSASGTFTVQGTADGCTSAASAPTTVTVNPIPPAPTITPGGPTTFCEGGNVVLTASAGYDSYLWSNGATTQSILVSASDTYTVQGANAGCMSAASAPTTVIVNPGPATPTITPEPTSVCVDGTGNTASIADPGAGITIFWTVTNGTLTGGQGTPGIVYTAGSSGTVVVDVILTNASGCTSGASANVGIDVVSATITATPSTINFFQTATVDFTIVGGMGWELSSSNDNTLTPDFGSGSGSFSSTFFANGGTGLDTVTLTVYDNCETAYTFTVDIQVEGQPQRP